MIGNRVRQCRTLWRGDVENPTDQAATLWADNLRLAWKEATGFARRWPEFDLDVLKQECQVALGKAAQSFDPSQGNRFSTYAVCCIRNHLKSIMLEVRPLGYRCGDWRRQACPVVRSDADLNAQSERGWVQRQFYGHDDCVSALETLAVAPESTSVVAWDDEKWRKVLRYLPARHQKLIQWRYRRGWSTRRVGRRLGITHQRVSQLERAAIAALRSRAAELADEL